MYKHQGGQYWFWFQESKSIDSGIKMEWFMNQNGLNHDSIVLNQSWIKVDWFMNQNGMIIINQMERVLIQNAWFRNDSWIKMVVSGNDSNIIFFIALAYSCISHWAVGSSLSSIKFIIWFKPPKNCPIIRMLIIIIQTIIKN